MHLLINNVSVPTYPDSNYVLLFNQKLLVNLAHETASCTCSHSKNLGLSLASSCDGAFLLPLVQGQAQWIQCNQLRACELLTKFSSSSVEVSITT